MADINVGNGVKVTEIMVILLHIESELTELPNDGPKQDLGAAFLFLVGVLAEISGEMLPSWDMIWGKKSRRRFQCSNFSKWRFSNVLQQKTLGR